MVYNLDWQLKIDGRSIKGGSFLAVASCELIGDRFFIKLLDESGASDSFKVNSGVNIGGKDYLLLEKISMGSIDSTNSTDLVTSMTSMNSTNPTNPMNPMSSMHSPGSLDKTLTVVRFFDRTRVCAMDADRFSSLRNAFLTFLETGESTPLATLQVLLNGN